MNRRRMLMLKKQDGDLPQGFTKVDWLRGQGRQYILTPIYSTKNTVVNCEIERDSYIDGTYCIFGNSYDTSSGKPSYCLTIQSNRFQGRIGQDAWFDTGKFANRGTRYTINISWKKYIINGIAYETTSVDNWNDLKVNIAIFARYAYNDGLFYNISNGIKLYKFEIIQDEKLIFNGIPCLDENNRPCMYDTISKQPFYNQGSGEFAYGYDS